MKSTTVNNNLKKVILGVDIGTSGIRGCIVERPAHNSTNPEQNQNILTTQSISLESPLLNHQSGASTQDPTLWVETLQQLFQRLSKYADLSLITNLVVDATSSTVLLCDPHGTPLTDALMYNDQQATYQAKQIADFSGFNPNSGANGSSSTLAKVLFLFKQLNPKADSEQVIICHQIDFINHYLCGALNITDENSALKLGYDSIHQMWPKWCLELLRQSWQGLKNIPPLPKIVCPGTELGLIRPELVDHFNFSKTLKIHAGTTDSIAGFLASGASHEGDAVTSLGSTLAVKLVTKKPLFSAKHGVYSHKLKNHWLVGGASNAGGAVLLADYTIGEIKQLVESIESNADEQPISDAITGNAESTYYPLIKPGERFPIADANYPPKMPPKPEDPLFDSKTGTISENHQQYFIALLQGLTHIENLAYQTLFEMGASELKQLYSVGGGMKNSIWMTLRDNQFKSKTTLKTALSLDAAYGVTKLIE
ncbi:MAG: D-ribulokinase [Thiomicrorhabdus sp.]|nr:MAG: D-ribulokinase [Thiomicrorhabdus sp.]